MRAYDSDREALVDRMMARRQSVSVTLPVDLVLAVERHARAVHGGSRSAAAEDLVARGLDALRAEQGRDR